MPRETFNLNLSHPEWCAQTRQDQCGPDSPFIAERCHESSRKILTTFTDPIAGDEPITATARNSVMDGQTYADDPAFGGGVEFEISNVLVKEHDDKLYSDGGTASMYLSAANARALANFLVAQAEEYEAWEKSQDAARHATDLEVTESQIVEQKRAELESSAKPTKPAADDWAKRPAGKREAKAAVVSEEWHPSFCQLTRRCEFQAGTSAYHHMGFIAGLNLPSNSDPTARTGTGNELSAKAWAEFTTDADTNKGYQNPEACLVLSNEDRDEHTGLRLSTSRLRILGNWMIKQAQEIEEDHQAAISELQQRNGSRKAAA